MYERNIYCLHWQAQVTFRYSTDGFKVGSLLKQDLNILHIFYHLSAILFQFKN